VHTPDCRPRCTWPNWSRHVLLEAVNLGERASGLNGGQVMRASIDPDELLSQFGPQLGPKVIETSQWAGARLRSDQKVRYRLRCGARRLDPAGHSERELVPIRARVEQWRAGALTRNY